MIGMLAIIPVLLSFNAIYVLIPIILIIILIAAAAGLTRGTDIFELLGFGAIMGFTSGMGQGRAKGLRGRRYSSGGSKGAQRLQKRSRAAKAKSRGAAAKANRKSGGSVVKGATKFGALGGRLAMRRKVREQMLSKARIHNTLSTPSAKEGAGVARNKMRLSTRFNRIKTAAGRAEKKSSTHNKIAEGLRNKKSTGGARYERPGRLGYAKGMLYIGRKGKRIWIPGAATAGAVVGGMVGLGSAIRYRGRVRLNKKELAGNSKLSGLYDKEGNKLRPASKNERLEIKAMKHDKIKEVYTRRQESNELKQYKLDVGRKQYRQEKKAVREGIKKQTSKESEERFMHEKIIDEKTGKVISQGVGQHIADNLAGGFSNRKHLNKYLGMPEEKKRAEAERQVKRMKQIGDKYGVTAATFYAAVMFTGPTLRNAWRQRNAQKTDNSPHSTLAEPGAAAGGQAKSSAGAGGSGGGSGATNTGTGGNNNASGTSSKREARLNLAMNKLNKQKEELKKEVEDRANKIKEGGAGAVWSSFALGFTGDKIRSVNRRIKKTNDLISAEKGRQERENRLNEQNKKIEEEKKAGAGSKESGQQQKKENDNQTGSKGEQHKQQGGQEKKSGQKDQGGGKAEEGKAKGAGAEQEKAEEEKKDKKKDKKKDVGKMRKVWEVNNALQFAAERQAEQQQKREEEEAKAKQEKEEKERVEAQKEEGQKAKEEKEKDEEKNAEKKQQQKEENEKKDSEGASDDSK